MDLRALIRDVLDQSNDPDPAGVARDVVARIPAEDVADALTQSLINTVRQEISFGRGHHDDRDTHRVTVAPPETRGRPVRTAANLVADYWRRALRDRYPTGNPTQPWKFLADFTSTELDHAATARERHGQATLAQADKLRRLRKAVDDAGVATVGALPDDALAWLLGT